MICDNCFLGSYLILILGNCTGDISTWQLDQKIEISDEAETVLTLNSKISVHNDCVNGVRLVIIKKLIIY